MPRPWSAMLLPVDQALNDIVESDSGGLAPAGFCVCSESIAATPCPVEGYITPLAGASNFALGQDRCKLLPVAAEHIGCCKCARSSTDRASDYGSEGWGFESLRAHQRKSSVSVPIRSFLFVFPPFHRCWSRGCFPSFAVSPRCARCTGSDWRARRVRSGGRTRFGAVGTRDRSGVVVFVCIEYDAARDRSRNQQACTHGDCPANLHRGGDAGTRGCSGTRQDSPG